MDTETREYMDAHTCAWILVIGNVGDGFEFHGPFTDSMAASDIAEHSNYARDMSYSIVPVYDVSILQNRK